MHGSITVCRGVCSLRVLSGENNRYKYQKKKIIPFWLRRVPDFTSRCRTYTTDMRLTCSSTWLLLAEPYNIRLPKTILPHRTGEPEGEWKCPLRNHIVLFIPIFTPEGGSPNSQWQTVVWRHVYCVVIHLACQKQLGVVTLMKSVHRCC